MSDIFNIVICGVGGQGTLLASRVLGGLAALRGFDVKLSEVHGMSQRGGSVVTFCRYARNAVDKVHEPIVEEGEADIVIAFETLEALRYRHYLKKTGAFVVNDKRIDPVTVSDGGLEYPENIIGDLSKDFNVSSCDAGKIAAGLGNVKAFNSVILGVTARFMEFTKEEWLEVIEKTVPPKTVEVNIKAFEAGYDVSHA